MELRGVRVHNLQGIDVEIPWGKWVAISGVSGSGKSSLAFDTLYAEGQRRYLESLSPRARQFFEQLPLPEAEHIDPLPPAIAVPQNARRSSSRATLATATESAHYLRLLFAKVGKIICPHCRQLVQRNTPEQTLAAIHAIPAGRKFQIAFPANPHNEEEPRSLADWIERGYTRGIIDQTTVNFRADKLPDNAKQEHLLVLVDRLTAGQSSDERVQDSLEQAFSAGGGHAEVWVESPDSAAETVLLDGKPWRVARFSDRWMCDHCRREFAEPEPNLFNANSPGGACPNCAGRGSVAELSLDQLVPDPSLKLAEGAIACFREPLLSSQAPEWLQKAKLAGIPVDVPFAELKSFQKKRLLAGDAQIEFVGLQDMFDELQAQSAKTSVRVFLERWLLKTPCPACEGRQLQPNALAVRVSELNIAEAGELSLVEFQSWLQSLPGVLTPAERKLMAVVLMELTARIESLLELGLGYLSLNRPLATLSSGESQRVALARTVGHQLVNSLYIFDEPSTGLHPADCKRVANVLKRIQAAENTIVVVEHEAQFLEWADHLIDLGPGRGRKAGKWCFKGRPRNFLQNPIRSRGDFLAGRKPCSGLSNRRPSVKNFPRWFCGASIVFPWKMSRSSSL